MVPHVFTRARGSNPFWSTNRLSNSLSKWTGQNKYKLLTFHEHVLPLSDASPQRKARPFA